MSWRGSPVSVPAISAPTANVGCWTRRGGSAARRSTTTTTYRSYAPSTSCFAAASTRPTSPSSSRACVRAPTWPTSWGSNAPSWGRARTTRPKVAPAAEGSPPDGEPSTATPRAIGIDPGSDEAARLVEYGLAEMRDGDVVVVDPTIAEILVRTSDQLLYVRALLHIYEATKDAVDGLAGGFVQALEESVEARFGKDYRARGRGDRRTGPDRPGLSRSVELRRVGPDWTSHCNDR